VRKCCQSKPNDLVVMAKKEKTCAVNQAALKAFNTYCINKQQNSNRDNTIDFNDAAVLSSISKEAVRFKSSTKFLT